MTALSPESSRVAARARVVDALAARGIETAALDARILVEEALGITATDLALRGDAPIGPEGAERLTGFLARRIAGEPVARIIGAWEFWGLPFALSPETLVPRPDTETLVETALGLGLRPDGAHRVADLGTGSGCILVALLAEWSRAQGLGLDRSLGALRTARANARRNGVGDRAAFAAGDWAAALAGPFDLVVANPPYIASAVVDGLAGEVRDHDPRLALDGGPDGLDAYRTILAQVPPLLAPGGHLLVEIGYDQEAALCGLAEANGLSPRVRRDLAGHPRVVAMAPSRES
ncbi:SAM-dependent methyltransferase [Methylobacterium indicum]|uniref:Release factor glutamine methyltransferase n=1 Tax=Methylobacterium indicum TaxID=1775910 RepID=A0ABR5GRC0_9HYPH|nr:peptide chain release factor N(5)-glutamine methyltransferase [Methylobacterium indicum]KMO11662.1 SAM-dependent methyltransferase [Methylobacterium indicum]KMO18710.1 SAM-dependent methyltransferase [Methylobacterium indicum]KTS19196.1 SAM-dependent methyltransferase [Methylobacterium indicum]KTS37805.1 SAM-dependent methyltransferase [Methylobacterium indicum]KTS53472.1 SAM-dependent methyltransferase [Methylobacterium indicum]